MELYIFDKNINLKGILENYESISWTRQYNKVGHFEIHLNFHQNLINLIKKGDIIWKNDGEEAGYIDWIWLYTDADNITFFVISGKFLSGYLNRRVVWEMSQYDDKVDEIIYKLLDENIVNPKISHRKIDSFYLEKPKGIGEKIKYQVSYKNLQDEIEKIASTYKLGFITKLDAETKQLKFRIYQGLDRRKNQKTNTPAVFSREYENLFGQEYITADNDYSNLSLVAGEGQGDKREIVIVGDEEAKGLDRYELFVDARDLQSLKENGDQIPIEEYRESLKTRGETKLGEKGKTERFTGHISPYSNLKYKTDFDLGDIVTCVSKEWGLQINARITKIQEIYEKDGHKIYITFGEDEKGLVEKIKREVS